MSDAAFRLQHGAGFPYDAPDAWWEGDASNPPQASDWAHAAARGVIADLQDRRGIKWGFDDIDEETRAEIVGTLASIIRAAAGEAPIRGQLDKDGRAM